MASDPKYLAALLKAMGSDPVFRHLVRQLRANPTHHNHPWSKPDAFDIAVEDCRRCEAFFALPWCVLEYLPTRGKKSDGV